MNKLHPIAVAVFFLVGMTPVASAQVNPFDAVFAIMTQPTTDPCTGEPTTGCRGCHIADAPIEGYPYFGDTQDNVESFLRFFNDGEIVRGGWDGSIIASFLRAGVMPLGGVPWSDDDLAALHTWLDSLPDWEPLRLIR